MRKPSDDGVSAVHTEAILELLRSAERDADAGLDPAVAAVLRRLIVDVRAGRVIAPPALHELVAEFAVLAAMQMQGRRRGDRVAWRSA